MKAMKAATLHAPHVGVGRASERAGERGASDCDGSASDRDGSASERDGSASEYDGSASERDGSTSERDGSASEHDGSASEDGERHSEQGGSKREYDNAFEDDTFVESESESDETSRRFVASEPRGRGVRGAHAGRGRPQRQDQGRWRADRDTVTEGVDELC